MLTRNALDRTALALRDWGAVAPLNDLAGQKFGAVTLPLGDVNTMILLVPLWMIMLPLMVRFSQYQKQAA